jgi:hypothetical protein
MRQISLGINQSCSDRLGVPIIPQLYSVYDPKEMTDLKKLIKSITQRVSFEFCCPAKKGIS